jgi:hypothetical protein
MRWGLPDASVVTSLAIRAAAVIDGGSVRLTTPPP